MYVNINNAKKSCLMFSVVKVRCSSIENNLLIILTFIVKICWISKMSLCLSSSQFLRTDETVCLSANTQLMKDSETITKAKHDAWYLSTSEINGDQNSELQAYDTPLNYNTLKEN